MKLYALAIICTLTVCGCDAGPRCFLADYTNFIYDHGYSPDKSLEARINNNQVTVYCGRQQIAGPFEGSAASFGNTGQLLAVWQPFGTETHLYATSTWKQCIPKNRAGDPSTFWGTGPAFSDDDSIIALCNINGFFSIYCHGNLVYDAYAPYCQAYGNIVCFGSYTTNIYDIARGTLIAIDLPGTVHRISNDGTLALCHDTMDILSPSSPFEHWYLYNTHNGQLVQCGTAPLATVFVAFAGARLSAGSMQ